MKKLIVFFWVGMLALALCACGGKISVGEEVTYETNTQENLSMEVLELIGKTSAMVEVTNNTGIEFYSGNEYDFAIQVKQEGIWFSIETEPRANTSEAYLFETDGTRELTISWNNLYGALPDGEYRIVKLFFHRDNPENTEYTSLSCEFTID